MRRRLPASASDASREALNSSKQREAPPLPPDLLNLREDLVVWRLVGMLKGGQSFGNLPESYFTPVRKLRNAVIGACAVPCRDPSHGAERYTQDVLGPRTESDWLRGGSTSDGYCDSLRSSEMNSHPEVDISIE